MLGAMADPGLGRLIKPQANPDSLVGPCISLFCCLKEGLDQIQILKIFRVDISSGDVQGSLHEEGFRGGTHETNATDKQLV